jgi:predicted transcriptional regulator
MNPMKAALRKTAASSAVDTADRDRVRLSLDLSPELNSLLEDLASAIDGSKSDVLRKGIVLMELAVRAKREGRKFGIANPEQSLATEIVGL